MLDQLISVIIKQMIRLPSPNISVQNSITFISHLYNNKYNYFNNHLEYDEE